jgi:hypothetical protein
LAKSFIKILRKQNISLRRKAQYRSTIRLNIARHKANIAENGKAVFPASFRSSDELLRVRTSESRRFSAEKRRLMLEPNRFIME